MLSMRVVRWRAAGAGAREGGTRAAAAVLAAAEEGGQRLVQLGGVVELEVGDVAQRAEVLQQRRLDRRLLPHQEQDRRARAAEHVVRQLEGAALAHAGADVDEHVGLVQLAQPVRAEGLRREDSAGLALEGGPERVRALGAAAGQVPEPVGVSVAGADPLEHGGDHALLRLARFGEGLAHEQAQRASGGGIGRRRGRRITRRPQPRQERVRRAIGLERRAVLQQRARGRHRQRGVRRARTRMRLLVRLRDAGQERCGEFAALARLVSRPAAGRRLHAGQQPRGVGRRPAGGAPSGAATQALDQRGGRA
jgi:hypothetical protein